tara:strand:- start:1808 stop:2206 length:399 start_codon:yes stop_codon:yes gene_type:complete
MFFKARHIAIALALLAPTAPLSALAQATPNHVLQTIDTLMNELALLHEANLSKPPQTKATVPPNRHPRHVYQKAREIFLKADSARWLNGLKQLELPPPPTREITPRRREGAGAENAGVRSRSETGFQRNAEG